MIRLLEKATRMPRLAKPAVVFQRDQAVARRSRRSRGIGVLSAAVGTGAAIAAGRTLEDEGLATGCAGAGVMPIVHFGQRATCRADDDVFRVPAVLGQEIAGKEIEVLPATPAALDLHPDEVLHLSVRPAARRAPRSIQVAHLFLQVRRHRFGCPSIGHKVEVRDLLADDPAGHGVEVEADDVEAQPVCLDKGRAAAHEGIRHLQACEGMRTVESLSQRPPANSASSSARCHAAKRCAPRVVLPRVAPGGKQFRRLSSGGKRSSTHIPWRNGAGRK